MAQRGWKSVVLAGLLGALGLTVGCENRKEGTVRDEARQVGQAANELGQKVDEAAHEAGKTANEAVQGFKEGVEGVGGSGEQRKDGAIIGDKPGVINDGEGPLEQNEER